MRGDEKLSASCSARQQLRDGLEEVWMKACLGLVQGKQRRWTRTQQHSEKAKVTERAIGKLHRIEGPRNSRHLHEQAEPAMGSLDVYRRTRKREIHASLQRSPVSDLDDRLQRRGKIAAIVAQHRSSNSDLRLPQGSLQIRSELMIEAPAQELRLEL